MDDRSLNQDPDQAPAQAASPDDLTMLPPRQPRSNAVLWVIASLLAVIAACLLVRMDVPLAEPARGQSTLQSGARGVFAFTGKLDDDTFGLFMVDVDRRTLWCYELTDKQGKRALNLVAARLWTFDRHLEAYNVGKPTPQEVEQLVELQNIQRMQSSQNR